MTCTFKDKEGSGHLKEDRGGKEKVQERRRDSREILALRVHFIRNGKDVAAKRKTTKDRKSCVVQAPNCGKN